MSSNGAQFEIRRDEGVSLIRASAPGHVFTLSNGLSFFQTLRGIFERAVDSSFLVKEIKQTRNCDLPAQAVEAIVKVAESPHSSVLDKFHLVLVSSEYVNMRPKASVWKNTHGLI